MTAFVGRFGEVGLAKEVTLGTAVPTPAFFRRFTDFNFSADIALLIGKGISGIADVNVKTAQGAGQLKGGKIKYELDPLEVGNDLMAAFGTDTVTETASYVVVGSGGGENNYIDFVCAAGTEAATVTAGTYAAGANSGTDGSSTLCYLIAQALHTADSAHTYTVTFSTTTNKFTIATNQSTGTFSLLFNSGTNAAKTMATLLGFSTAADQTGAYTYTAGTAVVGVYSHAFSRVQSALLPSYTWWQKNGVNYPLFAGCMQNKMTIESKAKEFVTVDGEWLGLSYASGGTSQSLSLSTHREPA